MKARLNDQKETNIVGKKENAGNQPFSSFPTMFLSYPEQILLF